MTHNISDSDVLDAATRAMLRVKPQVFDSYNLAVKELAQAGRIIAGSAHQRAAFRAVITAFETACQNAAEVVGQILGDDAKRIADKLLATFERQADVWAELITALLSSTNSTGRSSDGAVLAGLVRPELMQSASGVIADLRLNVVGGKNVTSLKPGVHVTAHSSNVAIDSPGAKQKVQHTIQGVSHQDLLEELRMLSDRVLESSPSSEKDDAADAIVNAERELSSDAPDQGRVIRLIKGVYDRVEKIGISVAGGVISRLLTGGA